jgi:galactokinase
MPAAIDRATAVAARANGTRALVAGAAGFGEARADLDTLAPTGGWFDYLAGVASVLQRAGVAVPGADLWIESDVPVGAGVSSSAALEVAVTLALLALAGVQAEPMQVARWAQAAENDFVGAPCGIMDQFASACGVAGAALGLNCQTLDWRPISLPPGLAFMLVDSGLRHDIADGKYGERRAECEAAAAALRVASLSVLEDQDLRDAYPRLTPILARRVRHVVTENTRVRFAARALKAGDLRDFGRWLNASHDSLRDDMQVSAPRVDQLAAIAQGTPGVYGARMMGGGFGGSVLVAVAADQADAALAMIQDRYGEFVGVRPDGFVCRVVAGADEIVSW